MAWELTWPLTLMDFAVIVLIHGVLMVQGEALDSVWGVIVFFVLSPWAVRRALALPYGPWRIAVMGRAEERARMNFQQSLKVMWLLAWRTLPLILVVFLAISGGLRLAGVSGTGFSINDPLENALGLSTIDALSSLLFSPLLIPGMLRKRYRGFRLDLKFDLKIPQPARK
jgi:hypothetical protein